MANVANVHLLNNNGGMFVFQEQKEERITETIQVLILSM